MNDTDYRKLLLSAAFHAMTCDGELHQDELDSIQILSEKSKIFGDLELSTELNQLSNELRESTRASFKRFFTELQSANLELSAQMQVVEVVIRVVYADGRIDENEIMYMNKIISILGILPELLEQRFGSIRELLGLSEQQTYSSATKETDFQPPQITDLGKITFTELNDGNAESR